MAILAYQRTDAAEALDLLAINSQQVTKLPQGYLPQNGIRTFKDDFIRDNIQGVLVTVLQDRPEALDQRLFTRFG